MKIEFIEQEINLLKEIVGIAIKNGNSVNTTAFNPSPAEYMILCDIFNKIHKKK